MLVEEACRVLGVTLQNLRENEVRVAFARAVRLSHPDTGGRNGETAADNIDRAQQARDTLLKYIGTGTDLCEKCGGSGQVHSGLFNRVCPVCKGSGKA